LNQYSAPVRDLEKKFFARELKIVLQHNPPNYGRILATQRTDALGHKATFPSGAQYRAGF